MPGDGEPDHQADERARRPTHARRRDVQPAVVDPLQRLQQRRAQKTGQDQRRAAGQQDDGQASGPAAPAGVRDVLEDGEQAADQHAQQERGVQRVE